MMKPNYLDKDFDKKYAICGNSSTEEKLDVILGDVIAKNPIVRLHLAQKLEEFESGDPIPGPSLSQVMRQELAFILNAEVMS